MTSRIILFLLVILSLAGTPIQAYEKLTDADTRARLSRLITAALAYDLYNSHCRGFLSSMHADNVQTLTVEKFAMTLSQLSKALTSKSLTALNRETEEKLIDRIRVLGGCKAAKKKGYLNELKQDFQPLYDWLSGYP